MNRSTGIIVILVALGFLYVYNTPGGMSKLRRGSSGTGSMPPWMPTTGGMHTSGYDPGIAAIQYAFLYSREATPTASPVTINTGQSSSQPAPGYGSSPYQTALAGYGSAGYGSTGLGNGYFAQPPGGQEINCPLGSWRPGCTSLVHTGSNTFDSILNVFSGILGTAAKAFGASQGGGGGGGGSMGGGSMGGGSGGGVWT